MISIIIPCLNEEGNILKAIASLSDNLFQNSYEVIVVDGGSTDKTLDEIDSLIKEGYRIKLLHNEEKLQAYGMNLGIKESDGEIIARADAHCLYPAGYLIKCLELLEKENVQNAGGIFSPVGETPIQKNIAFAMRHPLGMGGCKFKKENYRGYAEGAYAGMFRREIFNQIGYYDPKAHPNEDSDLNIRILKNEGKIFVDSSIKVIYRPRKTIKALAKQFFNYGMGRCYTTFKHKSFTSLRQLGPVLLIPVFLLSLALSFFNIFFLALPSVYFLSVLFGTLFYRYEEIISAKNRFIIAACLIVMHLSWGAGFLKKLVSTKT